MGSLPGFSVVTLATILALMTLTWVVSVAVRNASVVDVVWSLTFLAVAAVGLAFGDGLAERRALVFGLVAVWAVRLSVHIGMRNHGKGEDFRYRAFRERYGPERYWWVSLFQVFWLQGLIAFVVSLPLQVVAAGTTPETLTWADVLGVGLWLVGFGFEVVGDAQLGAFRRDLANAGTVMDRGLWRYTRHPNYFGDATLWWGYGAIGLLTPWGWLALVGPLVMTGMLLKVSGVAMLERTIASRRPGYEEYVRRTSAFVPRPPRRGGSMG
jgi:steroid 5-alpha reductase family enzyme